MADIFGKEIKVCNVPCLQIIPSIQAGKELRDRFLPFPYIKDDEPFLVFSIFCREIRYFLMNKHGGCKLLGGCKEDGCLWTVDRLRVHPVLYRPALLPIDKDGSFLDTLLCDNSKVRFGAFTFDGLLGGDRFYEPLARFSDDMDDGDLVIHDIPDVIAGGRPPVQMLWRSFGGFIVSNHTVAQTSLEWLFLHGLLPCFGMVGAEKKVSF